MPVRDKVALVMACVVVATWVIVSLAGAFNLGKPADYAFNAITLIAAGSLFGAPVVSKARKEAKKWKRR